MTHRFNRSFSHAMSCALLAACTGLAGAGALAQSQSGQPAAPPHRNSLTGIDRLPESDLKALYLDCSRDAVQGMYGSADGALCSVAYEALKQRVFGGDLNALLAWAKTQRANGQRIAEVAR